MAGKTAPSAAASRQAIGNHRVRHDGWTAERARLFLDCLGHTGCVRDACRVVGISSNSAYRLKRQQPDFAAAWGKALARSRQGLMAVAYKRAVEGRETVIIRKGVEVERRIAPSDAMLALLLKRGDLSGDTDGISAEHIDLAGLPRADILTRDEWRLHVRFDAGGGKTVEPDPVALNEKLARRAQQLRRGLHAMAERGEQCPCCSQTLPADWPRLSLMALDTLGVIRLGEATMLSALESVADNCAAIEAAGLPVPRCAPIDLLLRLGGEA